MRHALAVIGMALVLSVLSTLGGCTPVQQQRIENASTTADRVAIPLTGGLEAARAAFRAMDCERDDLCRDISRALAYATVTVDLTVELIEALERATSTEESEDVGARLRAMLPSLLCAFQELTGLFTLAGVEVPPKVLTALALFGGAVGGCDA